MTRQIEKHALSKEAQPYIETICQNYEKLSERFAQSRLRINQCRLMQEPDSVQEEAGCRNADTDSSVSFYVAFSYLEGRTLEELLDSCLERDEIEKFHTLFDEYVERISYREELGIADYDLIFSNILITDDGIWHVIDYEWTFDRQIDTKEIAFRSIYCYLLENEKRNKLNLDLILKKLGVTEAEAEQYRQQELKFQKHVTGKRMSMAEIRDAIGQPVYSLEALPEISLTERQKNRVQIYEDVGEGFSEQNSFFPDEYNPAPSKGDGLPATGGMAEDTMKGVAETEAGVGVETVVDGTRTLRLTIEKGMRALRIDPCSDYCIVWLREINWNGTPIALKGKFLTTNGCRIGEGVYAFDTEDPNITIALAPLVQRERNLLKVSMQVTRMPRETVSHIQKRGLF